MEFYLNGNINSKQHNIYLSNDNNIQINKKFKQINNIYDLDDDRVFFSIVILKFI